MPSGRDKSQALARPPLGAWWNCGSSIALVLLVFVAFCPALRAGYIWDDDRYLTANPIVRNDSGVARSFSEFTANPQYYPIVFTSFWMEYRLWGMRPVGYHVVNLALHAASALLIWRLLLRLGVPGAWLAAALFAVHPIQTESVAWVTERKNILATFFCLLSALIFLRFLGDLRASPAAKSKVYSLYAFSLLLFAAAILSKSVTCVLPAALLVILWWKRQRLWRSDLLYLLPMFAMGLTMAAVTSWVEWSHVGAGKLHINLSPVDRIVLAGRCVAFYVFKLCWPSQLTFIYPRWQIDARVVWQWIPVASVALILAALFLSRNRIGKAPFAAAAIFCGALVPALGFITIYPMRYSFVADHFCYLATIPFFAAIAAAAQPLFNKARSSCLAASAALLAVLVSLSWRQSGIYKNQQALWRDTLAKNDSAWMAHNNLGGVLCASGNLDEARTHLRRALELKPDQAEVLNNLALLALGDGNIAQAANYCGRSLAAEPDFAKAHLTMGRIRAAQGNLSGALAEFNASVRLGGIAGDAELFSGITLLARDIPDAALKHFNEALRLNPEDAAAWTYVQLLTRRNDPASLALARGNAALNVNPNDLLANYDLASLLAAHGQPEQALPFAKRVVSLKPDSSDAHIQLARLYSAIGKRDLAVKEFRASLWLNPGDPEVERLLAAELDRTK